MIKYIDLFAGVGGIRLGVSQALSKNGIEAKCVLSSEINEKACETYQLNFGEHPSGDVKLINEVEPFDLLLGGFPCHFHTLVNVWALVIPEVLCFLR